MTFRILESAEDELHEAIAYYERQREGLGGDFAQEIDVTIQRIVEHPKAGTPLSDTVRRTLAKRFPYGVIYTIEGDEIIILAVMHLRRKPGYWKDRL